MSTSIVFCDEHSLDRTVDYLVSFEAGTMGDRYPTPYSTYRALRDEAIRKDEPQRPSPPQPKTTSPERQDGRTSRPRKLSYKEQRELEQLEARIDKLETEKESLQTEINASGNDYIKLQTLAEALQSVESELDSMMERWLELSEIAEGYGKGGDHNE